MNMLTLKTRPSHSWQMLIWLLSADLYWGLAFVFITILRWWLPPWSHKNALISLIDLGFETEQITKVYYGKLLTYSLRHMSRQRQEFMFFISQKTSLSFVFTLIITALKVTQPTLSTLHLFLQASSQLRTIIIKKLLNILLLENFGYEKIERQQWNIKNGDTHCLPLNKFCRFKASVRNNSYLCSYRCRSPGKETYFFLLCCNRKNMTWKSDRTGSNIGSTTYQIGALREITRQSWVWISSLGRWE